MWLWLDIWIVIIGALCAAACALPGCFLVLRKMSMMGDAISHAVLPGLALGFILTGARTSITMFIGVLLPLAALLGIFCAFAGHLAAIFIPPVFGYESTSSAGMMATVAGLLFLLACLARNCLDQRTQRLSN